MNLNDLPIEILSEVFDYINDVYEFMNLVQVCRNFQKIIKKKVLIITDSQNRSNYFSQISKNHLFMEEATNTEIYSEEIKKYDYFVVEFQSKHSIEDNYLADDYILNIVYNKKYKWQKIVKVLLTEDAFQSLGTFVFNEKFIYPHSGLEYIKYLEAQLMEVHKTICLIFKDKINIPGQLEIMGHEYNFYGVQKLSTIYFHVNDKYNFCINSKSLEILCGIINISMTGQRFPPLVKFFQESNLPYLKVIEDVSIQAGTSLKIFEKFKHLNTLSLQSSYQEGSTFEDNEPVELLNLTGFEITGNAISLNSINFPKLKIFRIGLYGSNDREINETLKFKDINFPNLQYLEIDIGLITEGLDYIFKEINSENIITLAISSPSVSFISIFDELKFDKLVHLELKHNEIDIITDLTNEEEDKNEVQYELKDLDFPLLLSLDIIDFSKFNTSFINDTIIYPNLISIKSLFKVKEFEQRYRFSKKSFPNLVSLTAEYSNRYGPLKDCDIHLEIEDMTKLRNVYHDHNLLIECNETTRSKLRSI